jgi:hypothetical protein
VPFSERPLHSIQLKSADTNDVEALCEYWRDRAKLRPLAMLHTPDTFVAELKRWKGLKLSDFRIARDSKGQIRGCTALYNPRSVQTLSPIGYRGFAGTLQQMLSIGSLTRVVRALPKPGEEFEVRFLTHLACDTAEIFHRLLDDAYSRLSARETLAYLHFRGNWRTLPPNSFVASSLPYGLYMILPPNQDAPPWPVPSVQSLPPDFEAAWL